MSTLIIKTNAGQVTDVLINDLGFLVPNSGSPVVTLTDSEIIRQAAESTNLYTYLTDNAFGAGSSTLILNDGTSDIAQADVEAFLASLLLADSGAFGVVKRNASGQVDKSITFNGTATVNSLKAGTNIDANNFKVVNLSPGTAATDAVNKAQLDAVSASSRIWKELVLSKYQLLNGGSGAVLQATLAWLTGQPSVNDTFTIKDGTTTETWTFKASRSVAFEVAIGASAAVTMANLAAAITSDSTLWKAETNTLLTQFNSTTIVIARNAQSVTSYTDRIYASLSTASFGQYVNFNGETDYTKEAGSQIPSVDPAVKTFGMGRVYSDLVVNETHTVRDADSNYTWNADQTQWESTGANGIQAGAGLIKTGDVLEVDFGEVGDIVGLGTAVSAGSLNEAARADHVHTHGDRGADGAVSEHDAQQVDVTGSYARIGSPANAETAFSGVNSSFGDAKYVGKDYSFGQTVNVPNSGTLYLKGAGGQLTSAVGKRMKRAGKLSAGTIQVDAADASRAYKLSVKINGTEVETVALGTGVSGNISTSFTTSYSAGAVLSVSVERTSGSGQSTFSNIDATVEINEGA